MADELIRYKRIKKFMFNPDTYLMFSNVTYNLNEDEIILLQSLITQEYFESFVPINKNNYVKYNSYDEVQPVLSHPYDNKKNISNILDKPSECEYSIKNKITSSYWERCFPTNYRELNYDESEICSFQIMIEIIKKSKNIDISVFDLKKILYEEYRNYLKDHRVKIIEILKN